MQDFTLHFHGTDASHTFSGNGLVDAINRANLLNGAIYNYVSYTDSDGVLHPIAGSAHCDCDRQILAGCPCDHDIETLGLP